MSRMASRPTCVQVQARNIILFSKREAARTGIILPAKDSRAQHIVKHLKLERDDIVKIGVVNGLKGTALVKDVSDLGGVHLSWNTWQEPPPPPPITLVLAMPRPRVMRRLWRRVAELGVAQVVITTATHVPPGYENSEALRSHIVLREVLKGLEQAGDTVLPRVVYVPSFTLAMQHAVESCKERSPAEATGSGSGAEDGNSEWQPVRTLLAGPCVMRQGPPEPATPAAADEGEAGPAEASGEREASSEKLAFITQCLQVRRELEDARWRRRNIHSPNVASSANPLGAGLAHEAAVDPGEPLKLVCHPGAPLLLSDAVVTYKLQMNSAGFHVWNWSEVNPEQDADADSGGVAGDHYYGSAAEALQTEEAHDLVEILAELNNAGEDREAHQPVQLTGEVSVGTTPLDARKWGLGGVVLAVGPERGWTDAELDELQAAGFAAVGLGTRTLASPTAVVSVLAICQEALR